MTGSSGAPASTEPPGGFAPGSRLGPYEIVGPLGSGGMGTVYRARDARLRRDVALKVINASFARPDSAERFELEARAAAALNHPNIVAVFDVGIDRGVPYVVSELLEGESLRARLDRGPIPYRRAIEYGVQLAHALAAAHAKRIYHRDVKPGNVFLMADGRVKLLDFGLAKLPRADSVDLSQQSTTPELSHPGRAVGTAAYMSPEQVMGQDVDHRSDIFSLGAVLYEMLAGVRAFLRPTSVETMSAVLRDEPPDILSVNPAVPLAAVAAVKRCLEKSRDERFQSARDLAFHLQQLGQATSGSHPLPPLPTRWRRILLAAALVAAAAAATLPWFLLRAPAPSFRQLTFHRGRIGGARFTDGGVVYSQTRALEKPTVSLSVGGSPEATALYGDADVLAFCSGELVVSVSRGFVKGERFVGTLATAPLVGGSPRRVLEDVEDADCGADGRTYAVARSKGFGAESTLEWPAGRVLYRSAGSLHGARVSHDGGHVAFIEDLAGLGTGGRVVVLDRDGQVVRETRRWANARGLAWAPAGEVWFTASQTRSNRALRALGLDGRERLVLEGAGSLTIWDTAGDGRALLTREDERAVVVGVPPGADSERDLSWFDNAGLAAVSGDGRLLLFGDRFGIYLRGTDGGPATKLAAVEGYPDDLSPDGRSVLVTNLTASGLSLAPTGPGGLQDVRVDGLESFHGSAFVPGARRILVNGREPGRRLRSYLVDLAGGPPRAVTDEDTWGVAISPDGRRIAAISVSGPVTLWNLDGGPGRALPGSLAGDRPSSWTADGRSLWVFRRGELPATVSRVDVDTGRRTTWKTLVPPDAAGVFSVDELKVTPAGDAYFYSYRRTLSELYEVRGLR